MSDDLDPSEICLDDACMRRDIHRKHLVAKHAPPKPHHRPSRQPVWKLDDPKGLIGAVARATSKTRPKVASEIINDVRDDYGTVAERSVYRYLAKLVERGHLIRVDLGFTFGVYIRPGARLLSDQEAMRDIIEGTLDYGKPCGAKRRYEMAPA